MIIIANKTIRELSTELNISKEAIYRKINYSMKDELKDYILKEDGKTFVTDIGQAKIFQSLKRDTNEIDSEKESSIINETPVSNNITNNVSNNVTSLNEYVKHLERELTLLQERYDKEVTNNREERETLYKLNQSLIDTFQNEQKIKIASALQLQDEQNTASEITPEEPKQSFFRNLFKR